MVIAIFAILIAALTPFVRMTRERANAIQCANNMRLVSLALHTYAADHRGEFPPSLAALYPGYVAETRAFDCPAANAAGTPEKPEYRYAEGLTESSPAKAIILEDLEGNHGKAGRNILRVGGSVEWARGGM